MRYKSFKISFLLVVFSVAAAYNAFAQMQLYEAAEKGDFDRVRKFISEGADVNAKDGAGDAPLHKAIWNKNFEIARYLVEKGADVNAKGKNGQTPLSVAAYIGQWKMTYIPEEARRREPTTQEAITGPLWTPYEGQFEIIKFLVEAGANLNVQVEEGLTPLIVATGKGYFQIVEYFVSKGANVNLKNNAGISPLHFASAKGHIQIVKLLLAKGAEVNAKLVREDGKGQTPLMFAAASGFDEIVKLLISAGADVNEKDANGNTALSVATKPDIIKILKYAGAKE